MEGHNYSMEYFYLGATWTLGNLDDLDFGKFANNLDQTYSNLIKLDQTCSKWINLFKLIQICSKWINLFKLDQICSKCINLFKLDQTCSKWINLFKLDQIVSKWLNVVQNRSDGFKTDQIFTLQCLLAMKAMEAIYILGYGTFLLEGNLDFGKFGRLGLWEICKQPGSNLFKLIQTCSKWINLFKLDQIVSK